MRAIGIHLPFNQGGVVSRHHPKFDVLDFVFRGPFREQLFVAVEPNDDDADASRKLLRNPRLIGIQKPNEFFRGFVQILHEGNDAFTSRHRAVDARFRGDAISREDRKFSASRRPRRRIKLRIRPIIGGRNRSSSQ